MVLPLELVTDFNISSSKIVRTGLCDGVPTIAFVEKKTFLYIDAEEWGAIVKSATKIINYFSKRKAMSEDEQVRTKNIVLNFTKRGRNRVLRLENGYPWITLMNLSPSPHLTLTSPSICLNKSESAKLCAKIDKISDKLVLMDKVAKIYSRHVNHIEEQTEPLDLSINTNTLLNNLLCNSSGFIK